MRRRDIQVELNQLREGLAALKSDPEQIGERAAAMDRSLQRLQEMLAGRRQALSARFQRQDAPAEAE